MSKILSFPSSAAEAPDYTGRLLTLNQEKIRKFTCGGFFLGPRLTMSVVPPDAQMGQIHAAVLDGRLLDITDHTEITSGSGVGLMPVEEPKDTDRKVYFVPQNDGSVALFIPKDMDEQKAMDAKISSGCPLVLPEGFGEEDKYLIRLDTTDL